MGGSTSQRGTSEQTTQGTYTTTPTGIEPYTTPFGRNYEQLYGQYQTLQGTPLGLQSAPIYSTTLDPVVQNAISKGIQGIRSQQGTQGRQTAGALGVAGTGANAALLNVLNRQAAISGGAAGNQLYSQGLEMQKGYDIARQQAIAEANRNLIAARQTQVGQISAGNQLLNALIQMAGVARGERKATDETIRKRYGEETNKEFI